MPGTCAMDLRTPDQRVRALAERQLGLVTDVQCRASGLTRTQVRYRVSRGALVRVHPGVLRLPATALTAEQRALAACWAAGAGAYASHETAGILWGGLEDDDATHVTVPVDRNPRIPGVVVHRTRVLRPQDRTRRGIVPVVTPPRALLALAADADDLTLARCTDQILRSRALTPKRLLAYLDGVADFRFPGVARLRRLAEDRAEHGVTESELETLAVELIRRVGLPEPVRQFWVEMGGRFRIDLAYPGHMLGIELDSREHHGAYYDPFRLDRERQNVLERMGWTFLHFVWEHLTDRPGYVVATVGEALGMLPVRWSSIGWDPSRVLRLAAR